MRAAQYVGLGVRTMMGINVGPQPGSPIFVSGAGVSVGQGSGAAVGTTVLTDATWVSTPAPSFLFNGGQQSYSLVQHTQYFNPALHKFSLSAGTLPTGVTLNSATGYEYNGTGPIATQSGITVDIEDLAAADDFASRIAEPEAGVVFSNRLQLQADATAWTSPGGPQRTSVDTVTKVAGASASFRVDVLSADGPDNGAFRIPFGRQFTRGDIVWFHFQFRAPPEWVYQPWSAGFNGSSPKFAILSKWTNSNDVHEVVIDTYNGSNALNMYHQDGQSTAVPPEYGLSTACSGFDIGVQNEINQYKPALSGVDPATGLNWSACAQDRRRLGPLYSQRQATSFRYGIGDPLSGAFRYEANEWMTVICRVIYGTLGQNINDHYNSRITVWGARAGQAPVLVIDAPRQRLGAGVYSDALWLLPYVSHRSPGGRTVTGITSEIGGVSAVVASKGLELGSGTLEYTAATGAFRFRTTSDGYGAAQWFSDANGINKINLRTLSDGVSTTLSAVTSLPQPTITVANASAFPSSGTLVIGVPDVSVGGTGEQLVQYTGKTGNTFTGCTGGTSAKQAGDNVSFNNYFVLQLDNPSLLPTSGVVTATVTVADGRPASYINYNDVIVGTGRIKARGGFVPQDRSCYACAFPLSENPISDGGAWINGATTGLLWSDVRSTPNKAFGANTVAGYNDNIAVLNRSFTPNQYAQGTVSRAAGYGTVGANHEIELLLRFQITANNARGYKVLWGRSGELNIVRWNGALGNFTPLLGSSGPDIGAAVDGDVLVAEIIGSTITVYKNGVQVATTTDATWSTGQPGIGFWPTTGSTPENYGWRAYSAGSM